MIYHFYNFNVLTGLLTFVNCYDVKETSKMQNVFIFAKVGALIIIIIAGLVWIMLGKYNFNIRLGISIIKSSKRNQTEYKFFIMDSI